jgi:hypothetical protein
VELEEELVIDWLVADIGVSQVPARPARARAEGLLKGDEVDRP